MKKTLVFDMDGTLLDSMNMWKNLHNEIVERLYMTEDIEPLHAKEESMIGYCYNMIKHHFIGHEKEKINRIIKIHLETFYSNSDLCKPHVYETLENLYNEGYDMYVATATDLYFASIGIKSNGLDRFIKKIYTPDQLLYPKENINYFKGFVEDLEIDPENIVFFDDAYYACENAKKMNMTAIGVKDNYAYYNNDVKDIVDYYINDFGEISDEMLN